MAVTIVKKAYHSPWWIPALSVVAVLALAGTLTLFWMFASDQATEREQEQRSRIAADRTICTFANQLRRQVILVGDAGEDALRGVVDVVLPPDTTDDERAARIAEIRSQLEPVFDDYGKAVDRIRLIDCASIPGADLPGEDP